MYSMFPDVLKPDTTDEKVKCVTKQHVRLMFVSLLCHMYTKCATKCNAEVFCAVLQSTFVPKHTQKHTFYALKRLIKRQKGLTFV